MNFIMNNLHSQMMAWMSEDGAQENFFYLKSLPETPVKLQIKIKSDLILSGVDYFISAFTSVGADADAFEFLHHWDGKFFQAGELIEIPTPIPFNIAVTGERLGLNLLQHSSSISTWTKKHVDIASVKGIKILDTRKTTPGLRTLEKYAVRVGGGFNHRLTQTDVWMIKDNHKACLGGLEGALNYFKSIGAFYNNLVVEIHNMDELKEAINFGVEHVMLDNFSPAQIKEAISLKKEGMTFEVSGGIKLVNLDQYLISGIDAISLGSLTYSAPRVDISLKYRSI